MGWAISAGTVFAGIFPMTEGIANPRDMAALKRKDKLFSRIAERYGDPPNWRRRPGFVSLCKIILEQQISRQKASYLRALDGRHLLDVLPAGQGHLPFGPMEAVPVLGGILFMALLSVRARAIGLK